MDTDVFNIGEVVEFYVVNEGSKPLTCLNDPPTYSVKFQSGSGRWATRMGTEVPVETNKTSLGHGKTSQMYRSSPPAGSPTGTALYPIAVYPANSCSAPHQPRSPRSAPRPGMNWSGSG